MRVPCWDFGRGIPEQIVVSVAKHARNLAEKFEQSSESNRRFIMTFVELADEPCPVCFEIAAVFVRSGGACQHRACEVCLERWIDENIPACRRDKQLRVPCWACPKMMAQETVLATSAAARVLSGQLERRFELQSNKLFPESMQLECPRPLCVGIGYSGYDTAMCFICEDQWSLCGGHVPREDLPQEIKACPKCEVRIDKTGGCKSH